MLKRITSLILAIFLLLSCAGCAQSNKGPTAASNATEAANKDTTSTDATETSEETKATAKPTVTPSTAKPTAKPTIATKATKITVATKSTKATEATKETEVSKETKTTTPTVAKPTVGVKVTKQPQAATKETTAATKATQAVTKAPTAATNGSSTESTSAKIETDEKLLSVDITLPASLFKGKDMTNFDADAYANEQGFTSAKVNKDGSVTVTMTKAKHKELLEEQASSLDKNFAEFVNGEDTPYIKEISHNSDFTSVIIKVDKAAYESAFDFTPPSIAFSVAMYQALTETEYRVEVSVVDVATGTTIKSITYPDALNG